MKKEKNIPETIIKVIAWISVAVGLINIIMAIGEGISDYLSLGFGCIIGGVFIYVFARISIRLGTVIELQRVALGSRGISELDDFVVGVDPMILEMYKNKLKSNECLVRKKGSAKIETWSKDKLEEIISSGLFTDYELLY